MIDIHTHLTRSADVTDPRVRRFFEGQGIELDDTRPVERLLAEMDRGGIDKAVVVGSPPGAGICIDNTDLASALKPHRDRLIGFGEFLEHGNRSNTPHRARNDTQRRRRS